MSSRSGPSTRLLKWGALAAAALATGAAVYWWTRRRASEAKPDRDAMPSAGQAERTGDDAHARVDIDGAATAEPAAGRVLKLTGALPLVGHTEDTLLDHPWSVAYDAATDMMFVSEHGAHRVSAFCVRDACLGRARLYVSAGATGVAKYRASTTSWTSAQFNGPCDLKPWPANGGGWVLCDSWNHVVRVLCPTGAVSVLVGSPGVEGAIDGPQADARLSFPASLAVSEHGVLFIGDAGSDSVRRFAAGAVTTVATGLRRPFGLALDEPRGVLYVAHLHALSAIDLATGAVTRLAGGDDPGCVDGTGARARFRSPRGLVLRAGGAELLVADSGNAAVRRVLVATGAVTTVALPAVELSACGALAVLPDKSYPDSLVIVQATGESLDAGNAIKLVPLVLPPL